jgi:hypothetical protein
MMRMILVAADTGNSKHKNSVLDFQVFVGQPFAEKADIIHFGSAPRAEIFSTRRPTRLKDLLGRFYVLYFQDLRLNGSPENG